jgi:hypothetical protein
MALISVIWYNILQNPKLELLEFVLEIIFLRNYKSRLGLSKRLGETTTLSHLSGIWQAMGHGT